jgi:predicted nucleotidyltransferase
VNGNHDLLVAAAHSLGADILSQCAFVGGCTVHLYLDNPNTATHLRATKDVDIVVEVQPSSYIGYQNFSDLVRARGFSEMAEGDGPICRFRNAGGIILDVMATEESVLNFGNEWYPEAYQKAYIHHLAPKLDIRVIRVEHFFATKIASWRSRGNNDLYHRDVEDILTVVDGKADVENVFSEASDELKNFVRAGLQEIQSHADFSFLVDGSMRVYRDPARTEQAYTKWRNTIMRLRF